MLFFALNTICRNAARLCLCAFSTLITEMRMSTRSLPVTPGATNYYYYYYHSFQSYSHKYSSKPHVKMILSTVRVIK